MTRRSSVNFSICFLILSLFLPAFLTGQNQPIRAYFSNTDLIDAFDQLEEQYELKIAYEHEAVRNIKVNCRLQSADVAGAFQQLLQNTGLEFQIVGPRRILIRRGSGQTLSEVTPRFNEPVKIQLTGEIRDALNAAALPYANIYCSNGQGTTTDESGAFQLEVDSAQLPLEMKISYVGYLDRRIPVGQPETLSIELMPKIQELTGITVFEQKPIVAQVTQKNATEVSIRQMDALPAFVGGQDVFRDLQLLPGISAHDDLSANFSVRGGQESENMIVFDGITLYNVDHYFGIFSAINPSIVDKVTIYKNAFPAEHGGRTSSVIDIRSNSLGLTDVKGEVEFNLLTTNAFLEIPVSKRIGLLLGGRITNKDIATGDLFGALEQDSRVRTPENNRLLDATRNQLTAIEPDFRFNDLNAKLFWQIGPQSTATASFFSGADDFSYSLTNNISIPIRQGSVESATRYLETADWRNRGASLQLEHQWAPVFSSHLTLGHSSYNNRNDLFYQLSYETPLRTDSVSVNNLTDNAIRGLDLNLKNQWQIRPNHSLDFGYQFTRNDVRFQFVLNDRNLLDGDQDARQHSLYAQYQGASLDDRLQVQIGLRQTFYDLTQQGYFSPRLSASYQLGDQWLIKGAWSRYYQFLRESNHETALGRTSNFWALANDRRFPVSSSNNRMLGLRYVHPAFDVDIEFYDRRWDGVVEHAQVFTGLAADDGKPPRRNFVLFIGEGRTRGMDVLLKKTTGRFTGWLAYTLSKNTHSFPNVDRGAPFPAQNDRRHQLQLIQQYQWNKWNFALTYVFTSGRPYTDLSILSTDTQDRRELSAQDRISYLDDYHRVDVSANYQFTLWKGQAEIGGSIFNLFNRENVKYRQYIYSLRDNRSAQQPLNTVLGTELQLLPFTPNLRFAWSF